MRPLAGPRRLIVLSGWLAVAGGLIFGLALAAIGLLHLPIIGAVAPVGGVLMMSGWLVLAFAAFRSHSVNA